MSAATKAIEAGHIWTFPGGIHPPERKDRSNSTPIEVLPLAKQFIVPIKQHSGPVGDLLVAVGDNVKAGQPLTQVGINNALPVHAPTSGTVSAIGPGRIAHPSGLTDTVITIDADGNDEFYSFAPLADYTSLSRAELLDRIRQAGVAGLGGAGFPTAQKLALQRPLDYLIINGVECEPYISADDRLMREHAQTIIDGTEILLHIAGCEKALIAIEANKPEAIAAFEALLPNYPQLALRVVPTKYPSGGEKQLIQLLTGRQVPSRGLPIDVGLVMQNVGTAYAVAQAVLNGKPLIERVVTVTGDNIAKPGNYWVRIGTTVAELLNQCGFEPVADSKQEQRVIMGGPMMGFTLPDLDVPVVKITNCILVPSNQELAPAAEEMNCIRCGACADVCPAQLLPQQMQWLAKAKDYDGLEQQNLFDCIECGACAYVCPSEIPLVHYYRKAKAEIRNIAREKAKAEVARERFEARQERLEREKQERLERHRKAAEARKKAQAEAVAQGGDNPQDAVQAAIARAKARKAAQAAAAAKQNQEGDDE
ncbi:electron transport complex subunit RsxC [Pseudidiomarina donghaiensis]|uniref:Ion-translocating oxidoreductase complex subunit C n=1 Tax=Pseudidiomarina donghaiensis TaxID=519452 RepID=A0A432XLU5_9GAMM|nr:electron transport complex subunit RsxC [Pseudidiomarina donghaiensis]RUO49666.1 electron transport complex subunit RsxC [Pseudidiomarina donghaiensis]SFV21653.1 electron transport complex protein RnfC [Pseudidiomarina donghaiensis]